MLVHLRRMALSPIIVMEVTLFASLADTAILTEPFPLMVTPFMGEVIDTVGGVAAAGSVIDTGDDCAELPAES